MLPVGAEVGDLEAKLLGLVAQRCKVFVVRAPELDGAKARFGDEGQPFGKIQPGVKHLDAERKAHQPSFGSQCRLLPCSNTPTPSPCDRRPRSWGFADSTVKRFPPSSFTS